MRKPSLTEWVAVAQIIATVATVASLFFVGIEVRRNTKAVQAASLQSLIDIARDQVLLIASDPDINRIVMVGDSNPSRLTREDQLRLWWLDRSFWLGMQTVYRQWQLGVLPADEWQLYNKVICVNIGSRGTRSLWPQQTSTLIPAFVQLVESCDTFRSLPSGGAFEGVVR